MTATFMALRASGRLIRTVMMASERSTTTSSGGSSGMTQNVSRAPIPVVSLRRHRDQSLIPAARAATAALASLLVAQSNAGATAL